MLSQKTIDKIAGLLKLDPKKLKDDISAKDEIDIAIDDKLQILDEAALASRDRNKYNEGKTAGEEMAAKEVKRKYGIDVEGNDFDKIAEALITKTKKEAGSDPDERLKDYETKIEQWKQKYKEAEEKITASERKYAEAALDRELLGYFPKDRDSKFTDDEYLTLIKKTIQIEEKDGKRSVIKDGKKLEHDKTLEPISLKEAIEGHFNERKWIGAGAGDGNGDGGRAGAGGQNSRPGGSGPKFSKISDVNKHLESQGLDPKGEKGQAFIQAVIKENPQIDFMS